MTIEVRRLRAGEGARLRELRLRSIQDAPQAFGATYEESVALPLEEWERRAARHHLAAVSVLFVAEDGEHWRGLAGGTFPEGSAIPTLFGMWVSPEVRRSGLGARLVEAVCGWAAEVGVPAIRLEVVDTNSAARDLYRRAGFLETGEVTPLPRQPDVLEVEMLRDLRARPPRGEPDVSAS